MGQRQWGFGAAEVMRFWWNTSFHSDEKGDFGKRPVMRQQGFWFPRLRWSHGALLDPGPDARAFHAGP